MSGELATREGSLARVKQLMGQWLVGKRDATIRTYRKDLEDFARVSGHDSPEAALAWLFRLPNDQVNQVVMAYRTELLTREVRGREELGVAPATLNRRLAALKSFAKIARIVGFTTARIEVPGAAVRPYRDTRGVGREAYQAMIAAAEADDTPKGRRDAFVLRCLHDLGLRRAEVLRLTLADLDLPRATVRVRGKTRVEDAWPIGTAAMRALRRWLEVRGLEPGPVVCSTKELRATRRGARGPQPLEQTTLNQLVRRRGLDVGVRATPHGLRHTAITTALDELKGDVRQVAAFSRHAKKETVFIYDDARKDSARAIQDRIAGDAER